MHKSSEELRDLIENGLIEHLPQSTFGRSEKLNEALRYALFPGGKRLRPVLTLLGSQLVNGPLRCTIPAACAIELLHTSSLILDDLPAMDDADVRRGQPALHLVFGEDVALLTALALLNQTYALFGTSQALIAEATACIGIDGMIGGQALDLSSRHHDTCPMPFAARNRKTSALMRLTLTAGAIAADASDADIAALAQAGECLGEAYQICDDLLDQYMGCDATGKTCHQDARHHRPNFAAEFGSEACQVHVHSLIDQAKLCLRERFGSTGAVRAMLAHIDGIVQEFSRAGLVSACS